MYRAELALAAQEVGKLEQNKMAALLELELRADMRKVFMEDHLGATAERDPAVDDEQLKGTLDTAGAALCAAVSRHLDASAKR